MPKRPKTPATTATGKPIGNAPHRVSFATEQLMRSGYSATRNEIMRRFGVSHTTAEKDIATAYAQIATDAERERPFLRTRETARMHRIALAAESGKDYHAAIAASARLSKINALETGVTDNGITADEAAILRAVQLDPSTMTPLEAHTQLHSLSLTPAQRRAHIEELNHREREITDSLSREDDDV